MNSGYWFKVPAEVDELLSLSSAQLRTYLVVLHSTQRDRNKGLLSVRQVAKRAHLSPSAVQKSLADLRRMGLIEKETVIDTVRHTGLYTVPITFKTADDCTSQKHSGNSDRTSQKYSSVPPTSTDPYLPEVQTSEPQSPESIRASSTEPTCRQSEQQQRPYAQSKAIARGGAGAWKDAAFTEFWRNVWLKRGKAAAERVYRKKAKNPEDARRINAAARLQAPKLADEALNDGRTTAIYPERWLEDGRYEDDPEIFEEFNSMREYMDRMRTGAS